MRGVGKRRAQGRAILIDAAAASANPELPAFLARPEGAPVYHGFPLVEQSAIDGWVLGLISDYGDPDAHYGDGCAVAPDGSRCGLVWECCSDAPTFGVVLQPGPARWGVYSAVLAIPFHGPGDAKAFLAARMVITAANEVHRLGGPGLGETWGCAGPTRRRLTPSRHRRQRDR